MSGIQFSQPAWFALLLLMPFAAFVAWRRRGGVTFSASSVMNASGWARSWRTRTRLGPACFQSVGLALVVVALARPVERMPLPHATDGIDVLICMDVSSSMAMRDLDGARTRLEIAKDAAASFVAGRKRDRIGVMTFARYADVICPPTLDHTAVLAFLRDIDLVAADGPEDATGLGAAAARVATVLASGAKSRVAILLTDGEENVAGAGKPDEIAPAHAAQLCQSLGVRVYSIAVGRGRRNSSGAWTELDTTSLRALASGTGGRFFAAQAADAVAGVYKEIDALETVSFAEPRYEMVEKFVWVLVIALALLVVGRLLGATVWAVSP